jgi:hypothetical protein
MLAIAVAACSSGSNSEPVSPTTAPTVLPSGPAPDPVETPCLLESPPFTDRGTTSVLGGARPDAQQLAGIDWVTTPECERIVFSFFTARGAPASQIGLSRLEFAPEQGILRIEMPRDVDASGVADALVEGALVERAFVVRSRSGSLAVDLHFVIGVAVEARGLLIGSPARLVVDLRPAEDGDPVGGSPPTIVGDIVVLSPSAGPAGYPLRVRGYARTRDDVVTARVATDGGPDIERRVTAAPSDDSWGEFAVTISEGPSGSIMLLVSTDAGASSGESGASVPLMIP